MTEEISVDDFQASARDWIAANRADAPRDYGAICPPDLVESGLAWQRRLHTAGYAGIHWPVEFGGRGLGADPKAAWMYECCLLYKSDAADERFRGDLGGCRILKKKNTEERQR